MTKQSVFRVKAQFPLSSFMKVQGNARRALCFFTDVLGYERFDSAPVAPKRGLAK